MPIHVFERWAGRLDPIRCAFLTLLVTGCVDYPDSDERVDDQIIYSRYDPNADFQDFKTFAISPDVIVFSDENGSTSRETLGEETSDTLVSSVVQNLKDRGYEQVEASENPDLGLTVSVLSGSVTTYYTDYWGYYWGYPYYYYYYPYYYSYSYNVGTLIVDSVDLKNAPPSSSGDAGVDLRAERGNLKVIWTGLVYGVLSESKTQNVQDAVVGIDQAFKQSPYFQSE